MLLRLPVEIQVRLLQISPGSSLKLTNLHFFLLYNDLFLDKLVRTFGEDALSIIARVYPWLRTYIRSLDSFRRVARLAISRRLGLKDVALGVKDAAHLLLSPDEVANAQYIKDSWKYVYSLFKNKRLFAEYSDYTIDEPTNYVFNHYVEINRTYLLSYCKTMWLAPGRYNLNIGLVIKHGNGLGTTKFEIKYRDAAGDDVVQTFYPPTNINEILPKNQFCFLKIGEFEIPQASVKDASLKSGGNLHLYKIQLIMEEIGLLIKSGFSIFFIDISQPSMIFNDYDLLFYACQETNYKFFINLPLKNLYKALNYAQNGPDDNFDSCLPYGSGNPDDVPEYDLNYAYEAEEPQDHQEQLLGYAEFFYKNTLNKRNFKFNTAYQRRQFINRFGDFEKGNCSYDREGLKWRLPILGEL